MPEREQDLSKNTAKTLEDQIIASLPKFGRVLPESGAMMICRDLRDGKDVVVSQNNEDGAIHTVISKIIAKTNDGIHGTEYVIALESHTRTISIRDFDLVGDFDAETIAKTNKQPRNGRLATDEEKKDLVDILICLNNDPNGFKGH